MTDYLAAPYEPQELSVAEFAFPASVKRLMPDPNMIPPEFKSWNNPWAEFQSRWFFDGLPKETKFSVKNGIDKDRALRHLGAIQGSFEPKHEHKMAAVAYLASLWFKKVPA